MKKHFNVTGSRAKKIIINIFIKTYLVSYEKKICKGCLNIHGTHVTANDSINDKVVFCFCFRCDGKLTKIPKRDFIFARVKTGQVGTWSPTE